MRYQSTISKYNVLNLYDTLTRTVAQDSGMTVSYTHLDVYKRQVEAPVDEPMIGFRVKSSANGFADGEQTIIPILPASQHVIESTTFYIAPDSTSFSICLLYTSSLKFDKKKYNAYYVTFTFTSDGKKETSDPIQAWISADSRLIPLKLIGKLKVGSIQIYYTGK